MELLADFSLSQHVTSPTHDREGILDVVITRDETSPQDISVLDVGLSDHRLIRWTSESPSAKPVYETKTKRAWRNFDIMSFRADLKLSKVCQEVSMLDVVSAEDMYSTYNGTLLDLLDVHAPITTTTRRVRRSDPWFDTECRSSKRAARKLERQVMKKHHNVKREDWLKSL